MSIKVIQTRYAGCHFRSRLEARWAVFFNHLGVKWQYEPEGFDLPSGGYLPDFYLPRIRGGSYFEVKPDSKNRDDDPRWFELVQVTRHDLFIAYGMPRPGQDLIWGAEGYDGWIVTYENGGCWDNGRAFCVCSFCGAISIEFEGISGRIACSHEPESTQNYNDENIVWAYLAASSARFEHGQSGA